MLAVIIGFSVRVWTASTDPDDSVETSEEITPDIGEYFINTTSGGLFLCTGNVFGSQTWQAGTNSDLILGIVSGSRSQSPASRSLDSPYQISSSRGAIVNYSVDVLSTLNLTTGESGTVFLEIASDSGFTTDVQELGQFTNANTGTLALGLALSQTVTANLSGYVPEGYYARLRTANNTGTPTFTYQSGQETLL